MKALKAASCGLLLAACGNPVHFVHAALHGQLRVSPAVTVEHPVSLAIAWYPAWATSGPAAPPAAITTQNVTYQGDFPADFTFNLDGPPPNNALADLSSDGGAAGIGDGVGKIAYGVLVAYEDLNGNGTLDTIPPGGSPIDNIVGLSVPDPSLPPPPRSYFVAYLDGEVAAGDYWDALALQQGYNLLAAHNAYGVERVPLDTDVSIRMTGTSALNFYACQEAFSPTYVWGQPACGINPLGGQYQASGEVWNKLDHTHSAAIYVTANSGDGSNATIALDGAAVPYDPIYGDYHQTGDVGPGSHEVSVAVPGSIQENISLLVPDQISIDTPVAGQTLAAGRPVSISWPSVPGAEEYDINFSGFPNPDTTKWLFHALTTSTSVTTPPIDHSGSAQITINALGRMAVGSRGASFITPASRQKVPVTFAP